MNNTVPFKKWLLHFLHLSSKSNMTWMNPLARFLHGDQQPRHQRCSWKGLDYVMSFSSASLLLRGEQVVLEVVVSSGNRKKMSGDKGSGSFSAMTMPPPPSLWRWEGFSIVRVQLSLQRTLVAIATGGCWKGAQVRDCNDNVVTSHHTKGERERNEPGLQKMEMRSF